MQPRYRIEWIKVDRAPHGGYYAIQDRQDRLIAVFGSSGYEYERAEFITEILNRADRLEKEEHQRNGTTPTNPSRLDYDRFREWLDKAEDALDKEATAPKTNTTALDDTYNERNRVVAALAAQFDSHLAIDETGEEGFKYVVCIHLPQWFKGGTQAAWHIPDRDLYLFSHLDLKDNDWDGHDTLEKYRRLDKLAKLV